MAPATGNLRLQFVIGFIRATLCSSQGVTVTLTTIDGDTGVVSGTEGSSIELLCQVRNLNDQDVVWSKGSSLITAQSGKYNLASNETSGRFILTILNLTRTSDGGTYRCAAGRVRGSILVQVYFFPDASNPMCRPVGPSVIEESTPTVLRCDSQTGEPPVDVEWSRNGRIVFDTTITTGSSGGLTNSEYTIILSPNDDGVNVTCIISSTVFPGRTSSCTIGPLVVKFSPRDVSITNTTYSQDNVTYDAITCSAIAFPPNISYSWSFNTPLDQSQQTLTDDNQTLVILNITSCETKIIATCLATNDVGSGMVNFTLCKPPSPTTLDVTTTNEMITETTVAPSTLPRGTTTDMREVSSEPASEISTSVLTTTAFVNTTEREPSGLTPALYAVIICGAIIILTLVTGVACYIVKRRNNTDDRETEKELVERNVRALSITHKDEDNEDLAEVGMTIATFKQEGPESPDEQKYETVEPPQATTTPDAYPEDN